jgi:cell shape-determining protein MreC
MTMALQDEQDTENELMTLREYLKRRAVIISELQVLKDDLKQLDEEFKDKLDLKTFKLAATVTKANTKVAHKFTFEQYLDILEKEGWRE